KDIYHTSKQICCNKPLFSYFLDGSRRIYKIDDLELGRKIFPIIGGQIGVACCERKSPSTFKKALLEHNLVLSLPSEADKDGRNSDQFFNSITQKINDLPKLSQYNLKFSKILVYPSKSLDPGEKFENLGIAKIQDEMIDCEKKIVAELVKKNLLNQDNYLLKDGSLQYKPMKSGDFRELSKLKSNYRCVVGLSKHFNPELSKDKLGKSNATKIAKLPLYHRTPAFMYQTDIVSTEVHFCIWYLRIRDVKYTESPFSGVVKVEKVLVTEDEIENGLNSDEVDLISANIINERNPVAYGSDTRWANHLYPVYLTEKYVKSQYISDLHFLNLF
ncbi:MAG: hypothetical protein GYA51_11375, partial [Candidatus Methanofastidiosa archaeon]|nr:hypothetical protein [Candidatus Methanofastidiosa archaeon]